MQLISHRIDLGKIQGPLADYLNNNEKFWILDNKKTDFYDKDDHFILAQSNNDDLNNNDKQEDDTTNTKPEEYEDNNQKQQLCFCNSQNKSIFHPNNNRLTIKQFVKNYTNISDSKLDAHQSLKWPPFTKTSQIPSKIANFDIKDATKITSNEKTNQTTITNENPIASQSLNLTSLVNPYDTSINKIDIESGDNNDNNETLVSASILDTSNTTSNDLVNLQDTDNEAIADNNGNDNERLIEALKPHPMIGYKEPFYYCKEHSKVQNVNYESILLHLMHSKDHQTK